MLHAANCELWQNMDAHPKAATYLTRAFLDGEVEAEAVEAYNHHHRKEECVGYVLRLDGLTLYFSGDTGPTEQMPKLASYGIDYAFLPCDGIYTMIPKEAAACAESRSESHGRRLDHHRHLGMIGATSIIVIQGTGKMVARKKSRGRSAP